MKESILEELKTLIREDPTRTGQVFRAIESGLSDKEIQEAFNYPNRGFVSLYRAVISGILEGTVAESTTRYTVENKLKALVNKKSLKLSDEAKSVLCSHYQAHLDYTEELKETDEGFDAYKKLQNVQGFYVYSYEHYLKYPAITSDSEIENNKYLYKVGKASNIWKRIEKQRHNSLTEIPQPLILLRAYELPATSPISLEEADLRLKKRLLDEGLVNPYYKKYNTGTEWYASTLEDIVSILESFGLVEKFSEESD